MGTIDRSIALFFNGFVGTSGAFDQFVYYLSFTNLLKGGVLVAILWALWFTGASHETDHKIRKSILKTYIGTSVALFLTKGLALLLPFRERPMRDALIQFRVPEAVSEETVRRLGSWSTFPSDHAALFIGLAIGIYLISRRLGAWSFGYVIILILFPRIYLGFHYPSDLIVGAVIGGGSVLAVHSSKAVDNLTESLLAWGKKHSSWFYGLFFLATYQTAVLYNNVREFGGFLLRLSAAAIRKVF
jgi:undecaprenyl-diphosphatase